MSLLDPRTLRALADEIGLRPTKQRGQNFVHDANTVRRIVAAAGVGVGERVIEVGPGLGSLTLGLLEAGCEVVAVEIEPALAARLPRTVEERLPEASARLVVIEADALHVQGLDEGGRPPDPRTTPTPPALHVPPTPEGGQPPDPRVPPLPLHVKRLPVTPEALVANLPYNVSVPVILHLLAEFPSIGHGLVMVQSEVADRLVAGPGSKTYGAPSAKLAWYARAQRVGSVPPTVFWPVPNVDSGLVSFVRHEPPGTSASREQVFAVVDAAFGQRRKMLRAALSGLAGSSADASRVLQEAGVDPQVRGETLDIGAFARIAEALGSSKEAA